MLTFPGPESRPSVAAGVGRAERLGGWWHSWSDNETQKGDQGAELPNGLVNAPWTRTLWLEEQRSDASGGFQGARGVDLGAEAIWNR